VDEAFNMQQSLYQNTEAVALNEATQQFLQGSEIIIMVIILSQEFFKYAS
jgi:hypothetical protein